MGNAIRMIQRSAKHQTEEARHPTTRELQPVYSRESQPAASTTYLPEEDWARDG